MATDVNTLSRLLQALAERRWEDAVTLGAALAKREERQGHFQAARRLRGALGETGNGDAGEVPWRATGGAPSALRALLPVSPVELEQVVLPRHLREQLEELALEWRLHEQLEQAGMGRRRKCIGGRRRSQHLAQQPLALGLATHVRPVGHFVTAHVHPLQQLFERELRMTWFQALPTVGIEVAVEAAAVHQGFGAAGPGMGNFASHAGAEVELHDGTHAIEVQALYRGVVTQTRHLSDPTGRSTGTEGQSKGMLLGGAAAIALALAVFFITILDIGAEKSRYDAAIAAGNTGVSC